MDTPQKKNTNVFEKCVLAENKENNMSGNRRMKAEHLTVDAAQASAEVTELLADALQDTGEADAIAAQQVAFVPQSEIQLPTADVLSNIIKSTGAGGAGVNSLSGNKYQAPEKILAHYDKNAYNEFQQALSHKEDRPSATAYMGHGKDSIAIPSSARDNANRLYIRVDQKTGNHSPIREMADKIQRAVFSNHETDPLKYDLAERSFEWAAKNGFDTKPLLGISQNMWHQLNLHLIPNDAVDKYRAQYPHPENEFNEFIDSDDESPVLKALRKFLDDITVRHLISMARTQKASLLACVRTIMTRLCDQKGCHLEKPVQKKESINA